MHKKGQFKVTYSTSDSDEMEVFHQRYDQAVQDVTRQFAHTHPIYISGQEVRTKDEFADICPIDKDRLIGNFQAGSDIEFIKAVDAASEAFRAWRDSGYKARCKIMRTAAGIISEKKYELAAIMSYEAGKSRLESMGDVEESADLIRYYCSQIEDARGFSRPMGRLSPNEDTSSVLRPFGVWIVISPFNFPLALAAGMSAGALVAGNTVVFKPSSDTPLSGLKLYEAYREAGVPEGVFHFVTGHGGNFEEAIFQNMKISGLVFTGSSAVGMKIYNGFSRKIVRPCILEMGGKNPAIVMETADLDLAAEGIMKSAYGLGGQKCSACSRVYVHKKAEEPFLKKLVGKINQIRIGDPTKRDVFLGPMINQKAADKFKLWTEICKNEGEILAGGNILTEGDFGKGFFVEPTLVRAMPKDHTIFFEELFLPLLPVASIDSLEEAIKECNKADYGLTAGIFSQDENEITYFFNEIETGVLYANKRTGATTGAWPGVQPFCGWKNSGSTGKGGCGPYYVQQFMREQSRTIMK